MKIDIVNLKAINVAALEHPGEPDTLEQSIALFRAWRKECDCSPVEEQRMFGVAYNDPEARVAELFHFDICGEVASDIASNNYAVVNKQIPAGRCARLRYVGAHDGMDAKVKTLYRSWLPCTEDSRRDSPVFFEYISLLPDVPESKQITDIYLPLK